MQKTEVALETQSFGGDPDQLPARLVKPVFLFGMERSGTTLLSMMVGAHPAFAVPLATTGMWLSFARRLDDYGRLGTARELERLVDDLLGHERIRLWDAELERDRILEGLPLGDYGAVVARFHAEYARQMGKSRWANVDIATLDAMDEVNAWLPDACFVHILRDGRDVALSHQTMPYGAGNIAECAEAWVRRTTTNIKMGRILGPERYHLIRYEDLILDPPAALARLCRFLGVAFSTDMLAYPAMTERKVPEDRRWLWPALDQPPDRTKVGRWKTAMSRAQRIVFEGAASQTLKELGYEAFGQVPKSPFAQLLELWYFLGRGARFTRIARKLGIKRRSLLERRAAQSDR